MLDIIIVGGGPAGLTAGLYAARAGKRVCIYEKESVGGQIVLSPMVDNYPGLAHISGAELANRLYEQVEELGVEVESDEIASIQRIPEGFRVTGDFTDETCRAVILATGVQHRKLGVEGEEELVGSGVSYCALCDGAFFAEKDVAVVGGGDTALQDALFLAEQCRKVTLLVRRNVFRAEVKLVEKLHQHENIEVRFFRTVERLLTKDGALTGLVLNNRETGQQEELAVNGVFLAVGHQPCGQAFCDLAAMDASGYFTADEKLQTAKGVFVAGDCRVKTVRQLTTAMADGAVAAVQACNYLNE